MTTPLARRELLASTRLNQLLADKPNPGLDFMFATATADADPGAGWMRLNNATWASATFLYVSKTDRLGAALGTVLQREFASGANVRLFPTLDRTIWLEAVASGAPTDATTYWKIPLTSVAAGAGVPINGTLMVLLAGGLNGTNGTNGINGITPGQNYTFATSTSMADPSAGNVRLNNATIASATAMAISVNTADSGNPSVAAFIATWDASTTTGHRGYLVVRKISAPQNFAIFDITGASANNTTWYQLALAYIAGNGSFSASDALCIEWERTGDRGATGAGDLTSTNNLSDVASKAAALDTIESVAEASIASATTTNIGGVASQKVVITGTTTITAFDTVAAGILRYVRFAASLLLTHDATSLIMPNGASRTTAAGDSLLALSLGSGNWRVLRYVAAAEDFYRLSNFASLAAAITAIGSTQAALLIDTSATVSAPATLAATTTLRALPGKVLTIATGQTLTVNGPIEVMAGQQIFIVQGSGRVALDADLSQSRCDVTWFGAKADASNADDGPAINAAINSRADLVTCTGQFNLQTAVDFTPWSTVGDAADAMKTFAGLGARLVQNANLTSMVNLAPTDGGQLFRKRIQIGRMLGVKASFTLTQAVYHRYCSNCVIEIDAIENGAGIGYLADQTSSPAFISGNNFIRINRIGGMTGDGFQAKALTTGVMGFEANVIDIGESGFNGGMGVQLGTAVNQRVIGTVMRLGAADGNSGRGVYIQGGGNIVDVGALSTNGTADLDCVTGITARNRIACDISIYAPVLGTTVLREHGLNGRMPTYRATSTVGTGNDTTEDTLQTYSIPGSTLKPGMRVRITAFGQFAANGNTKTVKAYFGAAGGWVWAASAAYNGLPWRAVAEIEITAANTQSYSSSGGPSGQTPSVQAGTATETDTSAIVVKVTGQNGTASTNDVTCQGMIVEILG